MRCSPTVQTRARPRGRSFAFATSMNIRVPRLALCQQHRPRHSVASDRSSPIPHTGDRRAARWTLAVVEFVRRDAESLPADDDRFAARAVRAFEIAERAGNVAGIDVA